MIYASLFLDCTFLIGEAFLGHDFEVDGHFSNDQNHLLIGLLKFSSMTFYQSSPHPQPLSKIKIEDATFYFFEFTFYLLSTTLFFIKTAVTTPTY